VPGRFAVTAHWLHAAGMAYRPAPLRAAGPGPGAPPVTHGLLVC
jgi:hypothetical protein